jgi:hypothetical protein
MVKKKKLIGESRPGMDDPGHLQHRRPHGMVRLKYKKMLREKREKGSRLRPGGRLAV